MCGGGDTLFNFLTLHLKFSRYKIERSTLTGENRQVILHGVRFPYALTVYQQDMFWTDWTEKSVFRAQKNDGSGFTVLAKDLQYQPYDIHIYSPSKQESCSSFCLQFNGGCSHTCVSGKSNTIVQKFIVKREKSQGLLNSFQKILWQVHRVQNASVLRMENGTWPTMVKTASKTQAIGVRRGSSPVWTVAVSIYSGLVMATRTAPTTQTSWRECVVRHEAKSD